MQEFEGGGRFEEMHLGAKLTRGGLEMAVLGGQVDGATGPISLVKQQPGNCTLDETNL